MAPLLRRRAPGGESLKDTVARVLPFYCQRILPHVLRGERVLVVAHGNSLRALAMALDNLTPETVPQLELATGVPVLVSAQRGFDRGFAVAAGALKRGATCFALRRRQIESAFSASSTMLEILPGAVLHRGYLSAAAQEDLARDVVDVIAGAPLFAPDDAENRRAIFRAHDQLRRAGLDQRQSARLSL